MQKLNWFKTLAWSVSLLIAFLLSQTWMDTTQWEVQTLINVLFETLTAISAVIWTILTAIWVFHKFVKAKAPWSRLDLFLAWIDNQK